MRRRFRPLGRSDKPRVLSNRMSVSMSRGAHKPEFCGGLRTTALPIGHARSNAHHEQHGKHNGTYHGHFTTGGSDERIESTLPPVRSPKMVPRS
jgi:hypothetical protein